MEVCGISGVDKVFKKNLTKMTHCVGQGLQMDLRTENKTKAKTLKWIHTACYAFIDIIPIIPK